MATMTVVPAPLPSTSTSSTSAPSPPRKKRANSRLQAWHDGADNQPGGARGRKSKGSGVKKDPPPLIRKVGLAAQVYGIQGVMGTVLWFQGWREWLYPPNGGPDIVKAYECRPGMPVRFDLTSPTTLPTILSVHGGGFCVGTSRDDDDWNRRFADSQGMLIISLPYSKAPRAPFPAGLRDLEALYAAVLADESLPIDRTSRPTSSTGKSGRGGGRRGGSSSSNRAKGRVALAGFDAGANLALALSQVPGVRGATVPPTAVLSISGILDLARPVEAKLRGRPYKPGLSFPRNGAADVMAATYAAYTWSYVPYGQDLRDPWLSPAFAGWDGQEGGGEGVGEGSSSLPPHVCLVGAELDLLAHESWRMACRLVQEGGIGRGDGRRARWRVPDPDDGGDRAQSLCGREQLGAVKGSLELEELSSVGGAGREDEDGLGGRKRFGFEVTWPAGGEQGGDGDEEDGSVRWILVPDVMHGFDRALWRAGGEETVRDAELKTVAYVDAVGRWLRDTVWKM
ncbi:hypothetical protein Daus18300_010407 [Diaporthe australafricana]|uniref:Alpha/beta hydrolase fold-3 domain-containing protein n=1 Tax=Diaporthe australafricana TaxID=127596 RepID=A0ABR3WAJ6_9PEZI